MSAGESGAQAPHHAAELGIALGWVAVGILVTVAAWRMDRLEALSINPYSVPGLVPGIAGLLMALFGLIVASRAWRARSQAQQLAPSAGSVPPSEASASPLLHPPSPMPLAQSTPSLARAWAAAALCIVFGGLLPGRGLPFVAVGAAFIFLFILLFATPPGGRLDLRRVATAAAIATVASLSITYLFGDVFLVRLP
jgi:hypothetical protein